MTEFTNDYIHERVRVLNRSKQRYARMAGVAIITILGIPLGLVLLLKAVLQGRKAKKWEKRLQEQSQ